jgi:low temperature requirement protein LtrA
VALAVGNELVIAHPGSDGSPALSLLLFGGALLYVAAQSWYLRVTAGTVSRARWAACAALAAGGCAALALLLIILAALTWHLTRDHSRA